MTFNFLPGLGCNFLPAVAASVRELHKPTIIGHQGAPRSKSPTHTHHTHKFRTPSPSSVSSSTSKPTQTRPPLRAISQGMTHLAGRRVQKVRWAPETGCGLKPHAVVRWGRKPFARVAYRGHLGHWRPKSPKNLKMSSSMPDMTGRPGHRTMEMNGGSSAPHLARTPCVPLFSTLLNRGGNRRAFRSIVRWNLRPVIFGVEFPTSRLWGAAKKTRAHTKGVMQPHAS